MMEIDLFIPCFVDQLYPQTAFNLIKILEKFNIKVNYNRQQTCCGQPAFNSGYWEEAAKVADKFLKDFPGNRPIVSPSASCTAYVRNYFPELSNDDEFIRKHNQIKSKLFEISDFLVNKLKIENTGATFNAKVTYHDACSGLREYGLTTEARTLLSNVKGLELIEMDDSDECCGFGGTFSVKFKEISSAMVEQKVQNALATGAEYIVSTEASCLLNIDSYIQKQKLPIKIIHLVDILATGI